MKINIWIYLWPKIIQNNFLNEYIFKEICEYSKIIKYIHHPSVCYFIALHCTSQYYTALHCHAPHRTALHFTITSLLFQRLCVRINKWGCKEWFFCGVVSEGLAVTTSKYDLDFENLFLGEMACTQDLRVRTMIFLLLSSTNSL